MDSSSSGFCSSNSSHSLVELEDTSTWKKERGSVNYYIYNSFVRMEESQICEFKGHISITLAEISSNLIDRTSGRKSRAPISRALNSFFNSPRGGSVYLGVIDSGKVKGIELSHDQREHLLVNLRDVLGSFSPPADCSRFRVRFVPLVYTRPETEENVVALSDIVRAHSGKSHLLRSAKHCWCETNARQQMLSGVIHPGFVIELRVLPWRPPSSPQQQPGNDTGNQGNISTSLLHPIYENEEGFVFIRGQGSQRRTGFAEILAQTRAETREVLMNQLAERELRLEGLRKQVRDRKKAVAKCDIKVSPLERLRRITRSLDTATQICV